MGRALHGAGFERTTAVITATPCSIACWIVITPASAEGRMIGVGSSNVSFGSVMGIAYQTSNTHFNAIVRNDAGTADGTAVNPVNAGTGWNHIVVIFTNSTTRTIYVNGGNATTSSPVDISVTGSSLDRTTLGNYYQNGAYSTGLNGGMAYPAFWSMALTVPDVTALASGISPKYIQAQSLVSYTKFSNSTGTNDPDYVQIAPWTVIGFSNLIGNPMMYGF